MYPAPFIRNRPSRRSRLRLSLPVRRLHQQARRFRDETPRRPAFIAYKNSNKQKIIAMLWRMPDTLFDDEHVLDMFREIFAGDFYLYTLYTLGVRKKRDLLWEELFVRNTRILLADDILRQYIEAVCRDPEERDAVYKHIVHLRTSRQPDFMFY